MIVASTVIMNTTQYFTSHWRHLAHTEDSVRAHVCACVCSMRPNSSRSFSLQHNRPPLNIETTISTKTYRRKIQFSFLITEDNLSSEHEWSCDQVWAPAASSFKCTSYKDVRGRAADFLSSYQNITEQCVIRTRYKRDPRMCAVMNYWGSQAVSWVSSQSPSCNEKKTHIHLIVEFLGTEGEFHVAIVARYFLSVHLKGNEIYHSSHSHYTTQGKPFKNKVQD